MEYVGNGAAGTTCEPHTRAPTLAPFPMDIHCLPQAPTSPSSAEIPRRNPLQKSPKPEIPKKYVGDGDAGTICK